MSWPFIAVFLSGWLYVDAAYRGPNWQRWLFRPVTLLLLLLWAWQAPELHISGYLICLGLFTALISDALRMLPSKYSLLSLSTLFLCYLLYTISFVMQMNFSFFFPLPLILLVLGSVILLVIWNKLEEMRWLVVASIVMLLIMVWMAGEQYFSLNTAYGFSLLAGTILLLLSHSVWLINHYRFQFKSSKAIVATCYFIGHFLIIRSIYL
ncbi:MULTISPECIES: lysoplasmalogenase [Photorhabdus]|uniref:Lysoplasmalogenase n=2 Tax=Photorhabdus TaxID=29487 RepID=A0ABX0B656_9GAMM|nr:MULTISPECIES: lysoplasmalogenase [Photorhabdus]MCC8375243.1 lysoplasmalogenase [Photorhabdus bodei]MCC8466044.1 lysoplasmalogenase [Photorhabdus bodei]MCT8352339.1 lysoplasmalogenase [Photorhabdus kayaii]MDB6369446.1 lysoplasmalogenase [Photorhabdus bodei]MDB6373743.1 lysoplasmalogenase [Photorhabdus bodei]